MNETNTPKTREPNLAELESDKLDLLAEKGELLERITELNARIERIPPRQRHPENSDHQDLTEERTQLVAAAAEIDQEIREINISLKKKNIAQSHKLPHIISLISAKLQTGDQRPMEEIAIETSKEFMVIEAVVDTFFSSAS